MTNVKFPFLLSVTNYVLLLSVTKIPTAGQIRTLVSTSHHNGLNIPCLVRLRRYGCPNDSGGTIHAQRTSASVSLGTSPGVQKANWNPGPSELRLCWHWHPAISCGWSPIWLNYIH
jgi:hypothetical protein